MPDDESPAHGDAGTAASPDRIAPVEDVPEEGTLLVTLRRRDPDGDGNEDADGDDTDPTGPTEAILSRLKDGTVVAYRNYCMHWTDVRLDKGSGALVRRGELVCQKHGATFQRDSGYCDFGPCEGASLERVDVTVRDSQVLLTDEDYAFVHVGPDESAVADSGSRIDFTGT
jgi:nitrite reductase/ring-hydroxylating ferredoxin subunit